MVHRGLLPRLLIAESYVKFNITQNMTLARRSIYLLLTPLRWNRSLNDFNTDQTCTTLRQTRPQYPIERTSRI